MHVDIEHDEYVGPRDEPLISDWCVPDPDYFLPLLLPRARRTEISIRSRILTQAIVLGRNRPDGWISHSRHTDFYTGRDYGRYFRPGFTFVYVTRVIDDAVRAGWLEEIRSRPGQRGWQSRIRATRRLLEFADDEAFRPRYQRKETIILRDDDKNLAEYADTPESRRMRRNLALINDAIASAEIGLAGHAIREGGTVLLPQKQSRAVVLAMHRVFNRGSFKYGGRFYGGYWLNIRKDYRPSLQIDGEATVERDYRCFHAQLLYALAGSPLDRDAYAVEGVERNLAKLAFNIALNSSSARAACWAVAKILAEEVGTDRIIPFIPAARESLDRVLRANAPVSDYFYTGAGLLAMRQDSDIAETVMLKLLRKDIVCLPVHDSFIVAKSNEGALAEAMDDALREKLHALQMDSAKSKGWTKSISQNGIRTKASASAKMTARKRQPNAASEERPTYPVDGGKEDKAA